MASVASPPLLDKLSSPKLPQQTTNYRFYAGFSRSFVRDVLQGLPEGTRVLDPWNGSGTTTTVATELGLSSVGVDLNPAMVVLAKAAMLTPGDVDAIADQASDLAELRASRRRLDISDPLLEWLDKPSVGRIRFLQEVLTGASRFGTTDIGSLDPVKCFWLSCLFSLVREATRGWRTSNPTWIKARRGESPAKVYWRPMLASLQEFAMKATPIQSTDRGRAQVFCGTSTALATHGFTPDFILGSPPYCTRLDYGIATRIELSVLGLSASEQSTLRRSLLGTTTVPASPPSGSHLGTVAAQLLDNIKGHHSKASATYYWKWLAQYLCGYAASLAQLAHIVADPGTITLVVQESFYKDIHIDLATLTEEALELEGWHLWRSYAFASRRSLAQINPRAEAYRTGYTPQESVLFFRRY